MLVNLAYTIHQYDWCTQERDRIVREIVREIVKKVQIDRTREEEREAEA